MEKNVQANAYCIIWNFSEKTDIKLYAKQRNKELLSLFCLNFSSF